jgi:uncharacterized protein (UPF0335 family)
LSFKREIHDHLVSAFGAENVRTDVPISQLRRGGSDSVEIHLPGQPPIQTTVAAMAMASHVLQRKGNTMTGKRKQKAETQPGPDVGHNSVAADQLKAFIERIERLEEEKAALTGDIRDVYSEALGNGFDTKAMRKIVAMRRKDHAQRKEEDAILELYMQALGMT